ncbi:MAG: acyl carrier protein [Planctomycetaceae bacterium]
MMQTLLREFFQRHHPAPRVAAVAPEDSLLLSGLLDSTLMLDLVTFLEQRLRVSIPDHDLVPEHFESLRAIEHYLQSRGCTSP